MKAPTSAVTDQAPSIGGSNIIASDLECVKGSPTTLPTLLSLGKDLHGLLISKMPLKDGVSLARTCHTLWDKTQPALLMKLLEEALSQRVVDGFCYLVDILELSPIFQRTCLNYSHLSKVLCRAAPLLDIMLKSDPSAAWKIAALSGMENIVLELLGKKMATTIDHYGYGVMAYYVLGGQLECLQRFLRRYHPPLNQKCYTAQDIEKFDPYYSLAVMASISGNIPLLEYLRDVLKYDLKKIFHAEKAPLHTETLLSAAFMGGDKATVEFLLTEGIDWRIGRDLCLFAAEFGHWKLVQWFEDEYGDQREIPVDAMLFAQYLCKTGNVSLLTEHLELFGMTRWHCREFVARGGHPEIFWEFVDSYDLSLDETFTVFKGEVSINPFNIGETISTSNEASLLHLLALEGHLSLLKTVLKDERLTDTVYVLDSYKQSLLHYAAKGGHWNVYSYLVKRYYRNQPLPLDKYGRNVAHAAASAGSAWFLRRLFQVSPALFTPVDSEGNSILHSATQPGDPLLLIMIIEEFGIDILATNNANQTVVDILVDAARDKRHYWNTLALLVDEYPHLLEIRLATGISLREAIIAQRTEEYFTNELMNPSQLTFPQ